MNQTAHVEHTPVRQYIYKCAHTHVCICRPMTRTQACTYIQHVHVRICVYMHCTHRHKHLTYMKIVFSNTVLEWTYSFKDKVIACHRGLQERTKNRYIKAKETIYNYIHRPNNIHSSSNCHSHTLTFTPYTLYLTWSTDTWLLSRGCTIKMPSMEPSTAIDFQWLVNVKV